MLLRALLNPATGEGFVDSGVLEVSVAIDKKESLDSVTFSNKDVKASQNDFSRTSSLYGGKSVR